MVGRFLALDPLVAPGRALHRSRTMLALDQESMDEVVLLFSPADVGDPAAHLEALTAEAEARTRGSHRVLAVGEHQGRAYSAHPYVVGVSLGTVLSAGPLDPASCAYALRAVVQKLAALHAAGLVHGDLHPGNVLVTPRGSLHLVGHALPSAAGPDRTAGTLEACVRYAPPEWVQRRQVDVRGDLYGLGLVAFELFAGMPLLAAGGSRETAQRQQLLVNRTRDILVTGGHVPAPLVDVLAALLSGDPTNRPVLAGPTLETLVAGSGDQPPGTWRSRVRLAQEVVSDHHLEEARRASRRGRPLQAATRLRCFADHFKVREGATRQLARKVVQATLWYSFRALGGGQIPPGVRARREALCLLLYRVASRLRSRSLSLLTRLRLQSVARRHGPLEELLPSWESDLARSLDRQSILERLRVAPRQETLLLSLAALTEGLSLGRHETVAQLKSRLLERHGLPVAALGFRLEGLTDSVADREDLEALLRLAQAAHQGDEESSVVSGSEEISSEVKSLRALMADILSRAPPAPDAVELEVDQGLGERGRESMASAVLDRHDDTASVILDFPTPLPGPVDRPRAVPGPSDGASTSEDLISQLGSDVVAAPSPLSAPVPRPDEDETEVAEVRFSGFQVQLGEGRLEEAWETLEGMVHDGLVDDEHFRRTLHDDLCRHLWETWVDRGVTPAQRLGRMVWSRKLVASAGLTYLLPICDRFLLDAVPASERAEVIQDMLVEQTPTIPLLRAAALELEAQSQVQAHASRLCALGWACLARGEPLPATRAFAQAREVVGDVPEVKDGIERVYAMVENLGRAAASFARIRSQSFADVSAELQEVDALLATYPFYIPALERCVDLCFELGETRRASRVALELGKRALVRETLEVSRKHLARAVRLDPRGEEALLYLASLGLVEVDAGSPGAARMALMEYSRSVPEPGSDSEAPPGAG